MTLNVCDFASCVLGLLGQPHLVYTVLGFIKPGSIPAKQALKRLSYIPSPRREI